MSQPVEYHLSHEDNRVIEAHQAGLPLAIYKVKQQYMRIVFWISLICFMIGIVMLLAAIIIPFIRESASVMFLWLNCAIFLLAGMVMLLVEIPRARTEYVIVCEQGALKTCEHFRGTSVVFVSWKDVQAIKKTFFGREICIVYMKNDTRTVVNYTFYQDSDDLFMLINERSELT